MDTLDSTLLMNPVDKPIHFLTLLDVHSVDLICRRLSNRNVWITEIEHAWVRRNTTLEGICGRGSSPNASALNYLNQIKGKTIFIDSIKKQPDFIIPENTYL